MNSTLFPEKWAIEINDEVRNKVGIWLDKIRDYGYAGCKHYKYYTYSPDSGESYINDDIPDGYTEITLEEWEKHYKKSFPKYWYTESQPEIVDYIESINGKRYQSIYLGYTGSDYVYAKYKGFDGCSARPSLKYESGWDRKEMTYVTFEGWKTEFIKDKPTPIQESKVNNSYELF